MVHQGAVEIYGGGCVLLPLIVGWAGGGVGGTRLFGVRAWLWQLGRRHRAGAGGVGCGQREGGDLRRRDL